MRHIVICRSSMPRRCPVYIWPVDIIRQLGTKTYWFRQKERDLKGLCWPTLQACPVPIWSLSIQVSTYWCVLRREWMGCWGLLGWLLIDIDSDEMDHSQKIPCVKRTSKSIWIRPDTGGSSGGSMLLWVWGEIRCLSPFYTSAQVGWSQLMQKDKRSWIQKKSPLVNKHVDPENHPFLMETSLNQPRWLPGLNC